MVRGAESGGGVAGVEVRALGRAWSVLPTGGALIAIGLLRCNVSLTRSLSAGSGFAGHWPLRQLMHSRLKTMWVWQPAYGAAGGCKFAGQGYNLEF